MYIGVLGAKDGLEHAIELPALAVAQRASDASNHLFAHVDEEIEGRARGTHRKKSSRVSRTSVMNSAFITAGPMILGNRIQGTFRVIYIWARPSDRDLL